MEDDDRYEDADELEMTSPWEAVSISDRLDLDEQWLHYLAEAEPPGNVENVDFAQSDYEDASASGEVGYA